MLDSALLGFPMVSALAILFSLTSNNIFHNILTKVAAGLIRRYLKFNEKVI